MSTQKHTFFIYSALLLILSFNLSSHSHGYWPGDTWLLRSLYWLARFTIELFLFYGSYQLVAHYLHHIRPAYQISSAVLISSIPFTLALAMLDIATGRPDTYNIIAEFERTGAITYTLWLEWLETLPRHLAFCSLLYLIHWHHSRNNTGPTDAPPPPNQPTPPEFLEKLSKSDDRNPLRIQAQEHYISVTTASATELIQYRFGKAIKELAQLAGRQVHRSYWVADSNVKGWQQHEQGLRLSLYNGDCVPVSRRFEQAVKSHYKAIR